MKTRGLVLAAGAVLGLSSAAMAQFSAGAAGPFNSDGPVGSAGNGIFSFNYGGPSFQVGDITLTGTATSGGVNSWLNELRYRVTTPGGMSFNSVGLAPGTTWVGGFAVNNTQSGAALGMAGAGIWTFEFFESFNDTGIDAIWTNINFNVQGGTPPPPPPPAFTGSFAGTPNVLANGIPAAGTTIWDAQNPQPGLTDGGGELANFGRYGTFGWDLVGNEVAYRIDHGGGDIQLDLTGLSSDLDMVLIDSSGLTAGVVAVSQGFGGSSAESILLAGAAPGTYYVVVDTFGTANAGSNFNLAFIPAPGALALLGLGGLVATRRRR